MNAFTSKTVAATLLGITGLFSSTVQAGPLDYYSSTYPSPNSACATYGNFVSCSTTVLDYLASTSAAGFVGPYGFDASQGSLLDQVVVAANNGNILENIDTVNPSEDGFTTNNGGNKDYFYTGDSNDPSNNGALALDTPHSWDIGLSTLINKLTFAGSYHQLLFAFDFNNPQNSTASLPVWAMVTIRNAAGDEINFETQKVDISGGPATIFKDPSLFSSSKDFNPLAMNTPSADDFALTTGSICVISATNSYPSPEGNSCPNGGTLINTNQASNEVEFINYIPSMDLHALVAAGYTTMSIQVWMGCFNTGDGSSGPALAGGGSVGPCDTGGYGDIFLLAGAPVPDEVPEPGTPALLGLTLLGLGLARRRQQQQQQQ